MYKRASCSFHKTDPQYDSNYKKTLQFSFNSSQSSSKRRYRSETQNLLNKSYFSKEILESATNSILKIVHPGKSEQTRMKRNENREKIKEHVLRFIEPSGSTTLSQRSYKKQVLPESSHQICDRTMEPKTERYQEKQKNMPTFAKSHREKNKLYAVEHVESTITVSTGSMDNKKPDDKIQKRHRSYQNIISLPAVTKRVSFVSPPQDESKRAAYFSKVSPDRQKLKRFHSDSFRTPLGPAVRNSVPPPLMNKKRATFVVTDSPMKQISSRSNTDAKGLREARKTKSPDKSPPETEQCSELNFSSFDFDFISKTPERIEEPYDLLGIASSVKTGNTESFYPLF